MSESIFEINAPGIDTEAIVAEVRAAVAEKMKKGLYADAEIARAERTNLANFKDVDAFQAFYLQCLHDAVFVDINDFDIVERRGGIGRLLRYIKLVLWKLLKFYTYRLWSQQNQVNGLLLSAVETTESRFKDRLDRLEARLARIEDENRA